MNCINLQEQFGDRYRISYDPAFDAHGKHRDKIDPFDQQIPCRKGTIYPRGGTKLAFEIDGRRPTVNILRTMPCLQIIQDGEREAAFEFDVADFDTVAQVVKPHRRVQWTEAQREAARQRMTELNATEAL